MTPKNITDGLEGALVALALAIIAAPFLFVRWLFTASGDQ